MSRMPVPKPVAALFAVLALGSASVALAQGEFNVLGLSGAPDAYVEEVQVVYGENFDLYVIISGPGGLEPLTYDFSSVSWAVLQVCCGGSPAYMYDAQLAGDGLVHEGEPILGVTTTAPECVAADVIYVATLSFTWIYRPLGPFRLGAASMSAAEFCGRDPEFLSGCAVLVTPLGITPAESHSWGAVKALYR